MRIEPAPRKRIELETELEVIPGGKDRKHWVAATAAVLVLLAVAMAGILPRVKARTALRNDTAAMAIPSVSVVKPKPSSPAQEIVLPANVQAYASAPIYARTNGYLRRWYVDIGARVKKGQLLAEIETPEVDAQLRQARANLATAQANLQLSQITANRYTELLKTDSVAKQEADNALGAYRANQAVVRANEANVHQLQELQSFQKIYAPFDGVITARNTDVGALINAGSSGGLSSALFAIAQSDKLRVYVNVPQIYSQSVHPGQQAELAFAEFPGRTFPGNLVRTADAIDNTTRTLPVEIEVNNPGGKLLSGAYAEVHLKMPGASSSYTLPVNTLLFRSEGLRVATVNGGKVELKPLTPGHDFGDHIEVIAGVNPDDSVIVNPPDSILPGQRVRIVNSSETTNSHQ